MEKDLIGQSLDILKNFRDTQCSGVTRKAAEALGMDPDGGLLSKWLAGTRVPSMTTLAPILAKLGARIVLPNETSASTAVIQRVTVHAPAETVCGENLKRIPVVGNAGAGSAMEFFEHAPDSWIPVLPLYFLPEMRAFKVAGDSMEPTIRKGAYIGVVPYAGALSEGSIYLVRDPHFGHIVKRIRKDRSGKLMLFSDNPNWEPVPMPHEGYENVVVGEVRWVWQQL